jgi:hypothetical protein
MNHQNLSKNQDSSTQKLSDVELAEVSGGFLPIAAYGIWKTAKANAWRPNADFSTQCIAA